MSGAFIGRISMIASISQSLGAIINLLQEPKTLHSNTEHQRMEFEQNNQQKGISSNFAFNEPNKRIIESFLFLISNSSFDYDNLNTFSLSYLFVIWSIPKNFLSLINCLLQIQKMKPRMFNLRKVPFHQQLNPINHHFTDNMDTPSRVYSKSNLGQSDAIEQLLHALKHFQMGNQSDHGLYYHPKRRYDVQARDKEVFIELPHVINNSISPKHLKIWISEVVKETCSSAFHYFSKNQMSFDQAKIYCSQNFFKNIVLLSQKYQLSESQIQLIDNHLKKGLLNYLGAKYPLTESSQVNKKLEKTIRPVDNIQALDNNYFFNSKIVFEYRENGDYNDLIMQVINDLMGKIDQEVQLEKTNYQDFEQFMAKIFEKVEDMDWMKDNGRSELEDQMIYLSRQGSQKRKNKQEEKDKYKAKVKEYTHYLIGRKIHENTPEFTSTEIQNANINIKSPQILRILTKWCEQLQQKYGNDYFKNRSQSLKVQKGENVNSLLPWMRERIDGMLEDEKVSINQDMSELLKSNYEMQAKILQSQLEREGDQYIDLIEKVSGKFSCKVVKNLHAYTIAYLNRLIHGILKVSKLFFTQCLAQDSGRWSSPPNLMTFKIGDLMRCKCSSKQKEILRIYEQLLQISYQSPQKLKIVRIKNRLRSGTNDILMNIKFNNKILCEIQLAIQSKASEFIKCSNMFHHYLYELERSLFGPLTELCSIWNNLDRRTDIYEQLIDDQIKAKSIEKVHHCAKLNKEHQMLVNQRPFICSKCSLTFCHNRFPKNHLKCDSCLYFICARCIIMEESEQSAQNILGSEEKIATYCGQKVKAEECLPQIGGCIDIQSKVAKLQFFTIVKYRSNRYVLSKDQGKIKEIFRLNSSKDEQKFKRNYIIYTLVQGHQYSPIQQRQAINGFIIPYIMKQTFKKYKETVSLMDLSLTTPECKEILSVGTRSQKQNVKNIFLTDNKIQLLPFKSQEFINLKWLILDRNPIKDLQGIEDFPHLKKISLENCRLQALPEPIIQCRHIKQLRLTENDLTSLDSSIVYLSLLKILQINNNKLTQLPQGLFQCRQLTKLIASRNKITQISDKIGNLKKLEMLKLQENQLITLPDSIGELENLKELDISKNQNFEKLPETIKQLKMLEVLNLQFTTISELFVPKEGWPQLRRIELHHTNITTFAKGLQKSTKLQVAVFKSEMKGFDFDTFSSIQTIQKLHIADGGIIGAPSQLFSMKNLTDINFYHNQIDNIKYLFKDLNLVVSVSLSSNCISEFPDFSKCKKLEYLNISENAFTYIPPEYVMGLKSLTSFICNGNSLQELPSTFTKINTLKELGLQNNKLQGIFSKEFEATLKDNLVIWPQLVDVRLDNNKLTEIPLPICNCPNLDSLNVQGNKIERIRPQISRLEKMSIFNINNNEVKEIPIELVRLPLNSLFMQNNPIKCIPKYLSEAKGLFIFLVNQENIETIECSDWLLKNFMVNIGNLRKKAQMMKEKKIQNISL